MMLTPTPRWLNFLVLISARYRGIGSECNLFSLDNIVRCVTLLPQGSRLEWPIRARFYRVSPRRTDYFPCLSSLLTVEPVLLGCIVPLMDRSSSRIWRHVGFQTRFVIYNAPCRMFWGKQACFPFSTCFNVSFCLHYLHFHSCTPGQGCPELLLEAPDHI
jgi:hypothetical protein